MIVIKNELVKWRRSNCDRMRLFTNLFLLNIIFIFTISLGSSVKNQITTTNSIYPGATNTGTTKYPLFNLITIVSAPRIYTYQSSTTKTVPTINSSQSSTTKTVPMINSSQSNTTKTVPTINSSQSSTTKAVPTIYSSQLSTTNTASTIYSSQSSTTKPASTNTPKNTATTNTIHPLATVLMTLLFKLSQWKNRKQNKGLVRFMDNCPWTSIVHGQKIFFSDFPYFMDIVHILWTRAIFHGKFFQKTVPWYMDNL